MGTLSVNNGPWSNPWTDLIPDDETPTLHGDAVIAPEDVADDTPLGRPHPAYVSVVARPSTDKGVG
jgi:hypothetical protein